MCVDKCDVIRAVMLFVIRCHWTSLYDSLKHVQRMLLLLTTLAFCCQKYSCTVRE